MEELNKNNKSSEEIEEFIPEEADFITDDNIDLSPKKERKIIKKQLSGVKVLGDGELTKKLTVKANRFSSKAVTKIENSGGKAEVI